MAPEPQQPMKLPVLVVGPADVGRLLRELEGVEETLRQWRLRSSGSKVQAPKTSHLLEQTVEQNKLNLLQTADRQNLQAFLQSVRTEAPTLHFSFSADPSPLFIEKLMVWLRREIHPLVLVTIGLQPNIGAGCIVRSPNRQFDFSLRQHLASQRSLLASKLMPKKEPA